MARPPRHGPGPASPHRQFVLIPSAVSSHSWNLVFIASVAAGSYALSTQEPFALDTRLHPPVR